MKAIVLAFMAVLLLPVGVLDATGVWKGSITDQNGRHHELTIKLKADGNVLSGTVIGGPPVGEEQSVENGKLNGDEISFDVNTQRPDGSELSLHYIGKFDGDRISGSVQVASMGNLPFTATKQ